MDSAPDPTHSPARKEIPLFQISRAATLRTDPAELEAYYKQRKLMWRNVVIIGISNVGWGCVFQIVNPLIVMRLLDLGVRENIQGTMQSANGYAVAFLVMLFSWLSDHTISRYGRRKPYL